MKKKFRSIEPVIRTALTLIGVVAALTFIPGAVSSDDWVEFGAGVFALAMVVAFVITELMSIISDLSEK